jgi:hypothetical protein
MTPAAPPERPTAASPQAALGRILRLLVALVLITVLVVMFLHGINLL